MKKLTFIFIIFILSLFFTPQVFAASIFISSPENINVGDTFEVLVNADTGGEIINSVNLSLDFREDLISFAGYKDENTVVKFWVSSPNENGGKVYLSGIVPGGVSGLYDPNKKGVSPIPLVRLLFTAKEKGRAELAFVQTEIFKNDGQGTKLIHEQKNTVLTIKDNIVSGNDLNNDKNPPRPFDITFLESSLFSRTPSMIVFEARDTDSGIKTYKIKMGVGNWKDTKSPQPISKSIFSRDVTVRAFDFFGNFQDASINIPGIIPPKFLLIFLILLILSGFLGFRVLKYRA